jgi:hypothetical protein
MIGIHKNKYSGSINSADRYIKLKYGIIPFSKDELIKLPARTRKTIYAYTSDKDIDVGWVRLQDIGQKILFGNFITINHDRKVYRDYTNISIDSITITIPMIQLL